jgi:hypothetical protein
MEAQLSYLQRRAEEERQAASKATNPEARKVHQMLAGHYEGQFRTASRSGLTAPLGSS